MSLEIISNEFPIKSNFNLYNLLCKQIFVSPFYKWFTCPSYIHFTIITYNSKVVPTLRS